MIGLFTNYGVFAEANYVNSPSDLTDQKNVTRKKTEWREREKGREIFFFPETAFSMGLNLRRFLLMGLL